MKYLQLQIFAILLGLAFGAEQLSPKVKLSLGEVQGLTYDVEGKQVLLYEGIRYGKLQMLEMPLRDCLLIIIFLLYLLIFQVRQIDLKSPSLPSPGLACTTPPHIDTLVHK